MVNRGELTEVTGNQVHTHHDEQNFISSQVHRVEES